MTDEISLRKKAVQDHRTMVRVRRTRDRQLLTAAVCPGCWNSPAGRKRITGRLQERGVEVISREDQVTGTYLPGTRHAPECSFRHQQQ